MLLRSRCIAFLFEPPWSRLHWILKCSCWDEEALEIVLFTHFFMFISHKLGHLLVCPLPFELYFNRPAYISTNQPLVGTTFFHPHKPDKCFI